MKVYLIDISWVSEVSYVEPYPFSHINLVTENIVFRWQKMSIFFWLTTDCIWRTSYDVWVSQSIAVSAKEVSTNK